MKKAMRIRAGIVMRKLRGILGDGADVQWANGDKDPSGNIIIIQGNNREAILAAIEGLPDVMVLDESWRQIDVKDAIKMTNKQQRQF